MAGLVVVVAVAALALLAHSPVVAEQQPTCAQDAEGGTCSTEAHDNGAGESSPAFQPEWGGDVAFFVMWHSPTCGHCQRLAPHFDAVAAAFHSASSTVRLVKVNAVDNRELAGSYGVKGFPTLHLFAAHSTTPTAYTGARTPQALTRFLNSHLGLEVSEPEQAPAKPSAVEDITQRFADVVDGSSHVVVLWTSQTKQSDLVRPEYERIALWFARARREGTHPTPNAPPVVIALVDASERQDLIAEHGIDRFPAISLFLAGAVPQHRQYEFDNANFVTAMAAVKISEWIASETEERVKPRLPPSAADTCSEGVVELTPDTLDDVLAASQFTLVEFFAPWCGHCKRFAPAYSRVARALRLQRRVTIARINADTHGAIAERFGVTGFPTLLWFEQGKEGGEVVDVEHTDAAVIEAINNRAGIAAFPLVTESNVVDVTTESLDSVVLDPNQDVLIMFYAPWCPHSQKALPELALVGESLRHHHHVNITIAQMDAEAYKEGARRYGGTHRYPTVEFFPRGDKRGIVPRVYMGPLTADHIVSYLDEHVHGHTHLCGGVGDQAGVLPDLADLLRAAWLSGNFKEASESVREAGERLFLPQYAVDNYANVLDKMADKGAQYAEKREQRLRGLVSGGTLAKDQQVAMAIKHNTLAHVLSLRQ